MASFKASGSFKPFKDLGKLFQNPLDSQLSPKTAKTIDTDCKIDVNLHTPPKHLQHCIDACSAQDEEALFIKAMTDVKPLFKHPHHTKINGTSPTAIQVQNQKDTDESEIRMRLNRLVQQGEGFVVAYTSEYMEWTGVNVNPWITQRLHRGDFTIQGYVDLHGLNVQEAKIAFDAFLKDSIASQKHAILIVHGRGLSSPFEPVLKSRVYEWLTSGENKKWIVAFSSARLSDGGAGATVALLRHHPLPKHFRKMRRKYS